MGKAFSPGYEAVAAMPFTSAGMKYAKGDRYPYRDLGIIEFDLRGLWAAERIEFIGTAYGAVPVPVPAPTPATKQGVQQFNQRR